MMSSVASNLQPHTVMLHVAKELILLRRITTHVVKAFEHVKTLLAPDAPPYICEMTDRCATLCEVMEKNNT